MTIMTVKTMGGRIYVFVGRWDSNMVFAPLDGKDDEVAIYSPGEFKKLLSEGRIMEVPKEELQNKQYC